MTILIKLTLGNIFIKVKKSARVSPLEHLICNRFCRKVEIVAIDTDKNTFLMAILIKLTLGNVFIKVKKSARAAPLSQNS